MKYQLQCLKSGDLINDAYTLHYTDNALLRAVYSEPFELQEDAQGVWKYLSWIPTSKANDYVAGTVTYKADALGEAMGLSNLWVTFHGHWPEKGGLCPTGSFKDMEAVPTIQRMHDHGCTGLICASAGNTARQFTAVFERTLATPGMGAGSGASASDAPHTEVYMTFMGSQSAQDWVDNLKTWSDLTNRQLPGGAGAVHHGVMKRAESVPINTLVARLNRGNCTVVLCGHSLGGAVATLVCHRLLAHPTADVASWSKNKRLRCITFGAPLVGDGKLGCHVAGVDFLDVFEMLISNFWFP